MTETRYVIDLYRGPGGWSHGIRGLLPDDVREVGIELDTAACLTGQAAGHLTIQADVGTYPRAPFVGRTDGIIASPPCPTYSMAGKGYGRAMTGEIAEAVRDAGTGHADRIPAHRDRIAGLLLPLLAEAEQLARERNPKRRPLTGAELRANAQEQATSAIQVAYTVAWIYDVRPRWFALEQVPTVLPLWRLVRVICRRLGYSVWAGVLNSADFGVPQTRERAICVGRSDGVPAAPPEPTHAKDPSPATLFGEPLRRWVSMAEALGWTGGAAVGFPRRADTPSNRAGASVKIDGTEYRARDLRGDDQPAQAVTEKARSWTVRTGNNSHVHGRTGSRAGDGDVEPYERSTDLPAPTLDTKVGTAWTVHTNRDQRPDGSRQTRDDTEPAPTLTAKSGGQWTLRNNTADNAAVRPVDEPAPTLYFGGRLNGMTWEPPADVDPADVVLQTGKPSVRPNQTERSLDEPASTLAFGHDAASHRFVVRDQSGTDVDLSWPETRPSTTVAGRDLVQHPGATANRSNGSTKSRNDGIRIELWQAAVLQSFPPDYPWAGTRTKQFEQVGNAVPPLLARAIIAPFYGVSPS